MVWVCLWCVCDLLLWLEVRGVGGGRRGGLLIVQRFRGVLLIFVHLNVYLCIYSCVHQERESYRELDRNRGRFWSVFFCWLLFVVVIFSISKISVFSARCFIKYVLVCGSNPFRIANKPFRKFLGTFLLLLWVMFFFFVCYPFFEIWPFLCGCVSVWLGACWIYIITINVRNRKPKW